MTTAARTPQLSIRSAKARALAQSLARRTGLPMNRLVEQAGWSASTASSGRARTPIRSTPCGRSRPRAGGAKPGATSAHDASAFQSGAQTRRALELDALAAVLPIDRRDRLAELLTDDDVEILKHLGRQGMGEHTVRALGSDLAYLEAWARRRRHAPARPSRRYRSNLLRTTSGIRLSGKPTSAAACRPTSATPRELVDPAPVARARGPIRLPCPPLGSSARRTRLRASPPAEE